MPGLMKISLKLFKKYWVQIMLFAVLISASTVFLLKPISDNDFFWHLKTGQWIWENGRLPDHDVFSLTAPELPTAFADFILTSYWLSQLLLYAAFLFQGMAGIVFLRFLLMAVLLFVMISRRQGDGIVYTSLLVLFSVSILKFYFFERPQVLSLLFLGILLLLLEKIKAGVLPVPGKGTGRVEYRHAGFIALLMLVWANAHGGHSVGQVTLLLFLIMEGVKFLHPVLKPMNKQSYGNLLIAALGGILCSLINPNTYRALEISLMPNPSYSSIQEYSSLPEFFSMSHAYVIFLYYFFMALTVILLVASPKETDITEVAFLLGIGVYSYMHARYAGFFPVAVLPLLGRRLSGDGIIRWSRRMLVPMAIFVAVFFAQGEFSSNIATAKEGRWISNKRFPVDAADFIISNNLSGNMYNAYDWGGYLIWRLAPERKVFIDGRILDANISQQALLISMADSGAVNGQPMWKALLQKYGVTYIITDSHLPSGEITPLVEALLREQEWIPVFSHRASGSVIFVRNVPENAAVINNYAIRKEEFREILQ